MEMLNSLFRHFSSCGTGLFLRAHPRRQRARLFDNKRRVHKE